MLPTNNVTVTTVISAVIGAIAWAASTFVGFDTPPEVVGSATTVIVGVIAYIGGSAKITAGAMSAAFVTVAVFALGQADVEIPVEAAAYLNSIALFVFSWITSEFADAGVEAAS